MLRALAEDPVGTAAAYVDAEAHRDTHLAAAQAWDEALRAENIDPQRVREDAAAHRDSASTDQPGTDRDLDTVGDSSRDGFAEDYLSALARVPAVVAEPGHLVSRRAGPRPAPEILVVAR